MNQHTRHIIEDWKTVVDALRGYTDFMEHLATLPHKDLSERYQAKTGMDPDFSGTLRKRLLDEAVSRQIKHTPQGYPWTKEERHCIASALAHLLADLEEETPVTKAKRERIGELVKGLLVS